MASSLLPPGARTIRRPRKIRYDDSEWALVVEHARACGQPPARYVREVSLGRPPKVQRGYADAAVVHELGRIGTTLNRLLAASRDSSAPQPVAALETALAELLATVRRLA
ncbi:MAG: plasmid mobilization protein [Gemmatimonadota bacterium]